MLTLMFKDLKQQLEQYRNLRDLHDAVMGRMRANVVARRAIEREIEIAKKGRRASR